MKLLEEISVLNGEPFELIKRINEYQIKYQKVAPLLIEHYVLNGQIKTRVLGTISLGLPKTEDKPSIL